MTAPARFPAGDVGQLTDEELRRVVDSLVEAGYIEREYDQGTGVWRLKIVRWETEVDW